MTTYHNLSLDWLPVYDRFDATAMVRDAEGKTTLEGSGETLRAAVEDAYRDSRAPAPAIDFDAVATLTEAAIREGWLWDASYHSGTWLAACNDAVSGKWVRDFEGGTLEGVLQDMSDWVDINPEAFAERRVGHEEPAWLNSARFFLAELVGLDDLSDVLFG